MSFRYTDSVSASRFITNISAARERMSTAQEQIATGKRINRPSDDPSGASIVLRVRTSQASIDQFFKNAGFAEDTLKVGDSALETYEQSLDQARALLSQGVSDTTDASARKAIATQLDSLRNRILTIANQRFGDQFVFGGTRQDVAPFDVNGIPSAQPTSQQYIQLDPDGAPTAIGVTADNLFSTGGGDIFQTLSNAAAALRGTGDPAADRATLTGSLDQLTALGDQTRIARAQIGAGLERVDNASEQLKARSLTLEEKAQRVEGADFVESVVNLTESQRVFEALLQAKSVTERRSLLDLLG
jgi:flagellar hook-associated protein 3 FlgL